MFQPKKKLEELAKNTKDLAKLLEIGKIPKSKFVVDTKRTNQNMFIMKENNLQGGREQIKITKKSAEYKNHEGRWVTLPASEDIMEFLDEKNYHVNYKGDGTIKEHPVHYFS